MRSEMTPVEVIVNRILIVEGNREEAEFLASFLREHRYETEIARDAGQARAAFSMHMPDFVITEATLPNEVSGFEICERMKRDNAGVPVLMLTAIDMNDARALALRVGVDAYVTKPYDPEDLIARIRSVAEAVWTRKHLGSEQFGASDRVRFACTECGKHLKAKSSHRGRTLNCPRCGQPVMIPMHG